jgi:D-tagatose-1,6-bisphosphate aldolase subunit GatZ/KbaZ
LRHIVDAQHAGRAVGVPSICSAHRIVLEAALLQSKTDGAPPLIESTCNQVNQFGGYTGKTPADFAAFVRTVAAEMAVDPDSVLLGGDHLGPNPWQDLDAETALGRAEELVTRCAKAGYGKIHLDASMRLADDPPAPLPSEWIAERTARLCRAAEAAVAGEERPIYVIGTEVPPPGGAQDQLDELAATPTEEVEETIALTRASFRAAGLEAAWERVVAVVVQPGVEFGDGAVVAYEPKKAAALSRFIEGHDGLVYEAHSTDYQTEACLRRMVADHFAILKVGPWLTFALREGILALAHMEAELLRGARAADRSEVERGRVETMRDDPTHWRRHYHGGEDAIRYAMKYSYSDRARYYWPAPPLRRAVDRLVANLTERAIPLTLLSQYMPAQYRAVRAGALRPRPVELLRHKVMEVTSVYSRACGRKGVPDGAREG